MAPERTERHCQMLLVRIWNQLDHIAKHQISVRLKLYTGEKKVRCYSIRCYWLTLILIEINIIPNSFPKKGREKERESNMKWSNREDQNVLEMSTAKSRTCIIKKGHCTLGIYYDTYSRSILECCLRCIYILIERLMQFMLCHLRTNPTCFLCHRRNNCLLKKGYMIWFSKTSSFSKDQKRFIRSSLSRKTKTLLNRIALLNYEGCSYNE